MAVLSWACGGVLPLHEHTILVLIVKRPLEPLSIFQDPSIRRLVCYVIPAVHTMVADILLEGSATEAPHVDQLATTHQLASGAAFGDVNPAAPHGEGALRRAFEAITFNARASSLTTVL